MVIFLYPAGRRGLFSFKQKLKRMETNSSEFALLFNTELNDGNEDFFNHGTY